MALVEMGVDVDEARPPQAAPEVDRAGGRRTERRDGDNEAIPDLDIAAHQALEIGFAQRAPLDQAGRRARGGQPIVRSMGDGGEAHALHLSSPGVWRSRASVAATGGRSSLAPARCTTRHPTPAPAPGTSA